tara:strand:+ start:855 stop:1991 length:1137 start_codon:yes stop_codon:yes gene_type:complete
MINKKRKKVRSKKRISKKRSQREKYQKYRKTSQKSGSYQEDHFEPKFKDLINILEKSQNLEEIRSALIKNIKDFIIFDIKHKGRLITGHVKTFSIKESHKSKNWKEQHKSLFSKIKEWGHGSTPSSQIYYQWWRYILKKCSKKINKYIGRGVGTKGSGYIKLNAFRCEAWGNGGKILFDIINVKYNQGNTEIDWFDPSTKAFVDGEDSIVHQAKLLAFEEISKNPDLVNPNVKTGGRRLSKRKYRKRSQKRSYKRGGHPKFMCGPDIDFVPEVHFNRLKSIFEKLKKETDQAPLEEMVDKLPLITKNKGKCYRCKELIDQLVKNTMPPTRILPIDDDDILWLQQFTGVHKGGMCAIMGGNFNKKMRKRSKRKRSQKIK